MEEGADKRLKYKELNAGDAQFWPVHQGALPAGEPEQFSGKFTTSVHQQAACPLRGGLEGSTLFLLISKLFLPWRQLLLQRV